MELIKENNLYTGKCDVILKEENKELKIYYADNEDLYMSMTEKRPLDRKYGDTINMSIIEEDGSIYDALYILYNSIVEKNIKLKEDIVDKENNVIWLDDDRRIEEADKFIIEKHDKVFILKFVRIGQSNELTFRRKNRRSIDIRFCMSGSRHKEYTQEFDRFYRNLRDIKSKVYKK